MLLAQHYKHMGTLLWLLTAAQQPFGCPWLQAVVVVGHARRVSVTGKVATHGITNLPLRERISVQQAGAAHARHMLEVCGHTHTSTGIMPLDGVMDTSNMQEGLLGPRFA